MITFICVVVVVVFNGWMDGDDNLPFFIYSFIHFTFKNDDDNYD